MKPPGSVRIEVAAKANELILCCSADIAATILESGTCRDYAAGDRIFSQGDAPSHVFLLEAGGVTLSRETHSGKRLIVKLVHPGKGFGFQAVVVQMPQLVTAEAIEPSGMYVIPAAAFMRAVSANAPMLSTLVQLAMRDYEQMLEFVESLAFRPAAARILELLLRLTDPEVHADVNLFRQRELAEMVGVSRETLNLQLTVLERAGLIRRDAGHVAVTNRESVRLVIERSA